MNRYPRALRILVVALAFVAGASICGMILVTCADIIGRAFGSQLPGAYDIVKLLSVLTIACGLPYTTAVKGHVAVEYFFHKMPTRLRTIVDTGNRLLLISLFTGICWNSAKYGIALYRTGEVTLTIQLPVFWVPFVISLSCAIVVLVVVQNLVHPGRAMMKP